MNKATRGLRCSPNSPFPTAMVPFVTNEQTMHRLFSAESSRSAMLMGSWVVNAVVGLLVPKNLQCPDALLAVISAVLILFDLFVFTVSEEFRGVCL